MTRQTKVDRVDLDSFYETARFFNTTSDTDQIAAHVQRTLMGRLAVTRAVLALDQGDDLRVVRSKGTRLPAAGALFLVAEHCRTLDLPNRFELRVSPEERLGVLALGPSHNGGLETQGGQAYLAAVLDLAASAVKRIHSERGEREWKVQLEAWQEVSYGLRRESDPHEIARILGLAARGLLGTPAVALVAWKLGRPPVIWPNRINIELDDWDLAAFASLREIATVDTLQDQAARKDLERLGFESLVPLATEGATIGFLALGRASGRQWDRHRLEAVRELAMQAAAAFAQAWSTESICLAAQVQRQILPANPLPSVRGFEIEAHYSPAQVLAGDWYDLAIADEKSVHKGRARLCFADIAGKGPNAALAASYLAGLIRPLLGRFERSLPEVLKKANERMFADLGGRPHATVFAVELDDGGTTHRYASAGHDPALIIRQDGAVEWLDATAPVLGPFKDMNFPAKKFALGRGDLLVLYSDGITEAERQGEEFGRDRLAQHLVAVRTRSAAQIRAAVIEAVEAFAGKGPQHDDITLLIVKRIGTAPFP